MLKSTRIDIPSGLYNVDVEQQGLTVNMNTSGKGLVALYLHKRGEQWMVQQIKVLG